MNLVCKECGSSEFKQTQHAVVEATMRYDDRAGWWEAETEIVDVDRDDSEIECADCGEIVDGPELVTEDEYNESEDE